MTQVEPLDGVGSRSLDGHGSRKRKIVSTNLNANDFQYQYKRLMTADGAGLKRAEPRGELQGAKAWLSPLRQVSGCGAETNLSRIRNTPEVTFAYIVPS
ncbi:hypothetical protein D3C85_1633910 [compost metagenome]